MDMGRLSRRVCWILVLAGLWEISGHRSSNPDASQGEVKNIEPKDSSTGTFTLILAAGFTVGIALLICVKQNITNTAGSAANYCPEGGAANKCPEGGAANKCPEGGAANKCPEGGAANKCPEGHGKKRCPWESCCICCNCCACCNKVGADRRPTHLQETPQDLALRAVVAPPSSQRLRPSQEPIPCSALPDAEEPDPGSPSSQRINIIDGQRDGGTSVEVHQHPREGEGEECRQRTEEPDEDGEAETLYEDCWCPEEQPQLRRVAPEPNEDITVISSGDAKIPTAPQRMKLPQRL